MHLAPASFNPQLIKGEVLQYCKGQVVSIKNNHALVEQSFHSAPLGVDDLKHHILQPRDFVYWKRHFQKNALQPHWRGSYQALITNPCATKQQGIDSWIHMTHLNKAPNPDWTCTSSGDLKVNISQK